MTQRLPVVAVIDDDESVRESLPELLSICNFAVHAFASAEEFLASDAVESADCLIVDVAMPGMTGPELYAEMHRRGLVIPTVFITARGDDVARARLLDRGAVECLFKPFPESALLDAIRSALSTA